MARPLPQVEMRYSGAWHAVTLDVYSGEAITTAKGRRDWASIADPSEMVVPFMQHESHYATATGGGPLIGRYAPRNPLSDLYGLIGRNTPVRLRLGAARPRLRIPGIASAAASTPDAAALRLTGDQRVELLVKPRSWRPSGGAGLARRYLTTGGQRAWAIWLGEDGRLSVRSSQDGVLFVDRVSSVAVPDDGAERWIAFWHDVNNGASGSTMGFETSPDGVTWIALGANQVTAGVFAYFAAQAPLEVGRVNAATGGGISIPALDGEIGALRYRSGILPTSTIVCSVDFRTADTDTRTLLDNAGRTWTLTDAAYISDTSIRFAGEASAWPQEWDPSGKFRSAPVSVSGVLRRAQKNASPLQSSLRRDLATRANVAAYYPMEERAGAPRFASGLPGDTTYLRAGEPSEVKMGANDDMFIASDPLPVVNDSTVFGNLPSYTPNASQRMIFLIGAPEGGLSSEKLTARFLTSGSVARIDLNMTAGGGIRTTVYDTEDVVLHTSLSTDAFNGRPHMLSVWYEQQGTSVFYQVARFEVGASTAFVIASSTFASKTFGRFTTAFLGSDDDVQGTVYGHLALLNGDVQNVWDIAANALIAWAGETGVNRLLRLGVAEGFPVRLTGAGDTPAMGPQRSKTFVELAREVPATDLGLFGDAADDSGSLTYRPARSMQSRPVLTVPYALLTPPPLPVDDDQGTANRITVKSANGIEFTAEDTTSTMSTLPPPAGVGLYDQSVDINANTPDTAAANAWFRLALGTIDASRWPELVFNLAKPELAPYVDAILALDLGDIIRVTDLPPGVPPGPIDLIADAIADEITRAQHLVRVTAGSAAIWGATNTWAAATGAPAGVARWSPANTYRAGSAINAAQTSISFTHGDARPWTTAAADFPLDIMVGGERMTVTAIAAGTTSQVFTVIRGVGETTAKSHPVNTRVELAEPFVWAL